MESAKVDQTQHHAGYQALDRALFGGAGERARLDKLAACYSKAIGEICFLQGTAVMCQPYGDFRVPNAEGVIQSMNIKLDAIKMLLAHYDSLHDLSHRARNVFFKTLGRSDVAATDDAIAEARRCALAFDAQRSSNNSKAGGDDFDDDPIKATTEDGASNGDDNEGNSDDDSDSDDDCNDDDSDSSSDGDVDGGNHNLNANNNAKA
jgi:hypothetical protein